MKSVSEPRVPLPSSSDEQFVGGNRVRLLRDGREAFPCMLEAIGDAQQQILLEIYWFTGKIAERFTDALARAAERDVDVVVLYDALGSMGGDGHVFARLAQSGARVIEYNPIAPWKRRFRLGTLTRRDHRKMLVVDGLVGFAGGINIGDPWLTVEEGGLGFRDDMVRVEGPAVSGMVDCLVRAWRKQNGAAIKRVGWARRSVAEGIAAHEPGSQRVRVLGAHFFRTRHEIARAYKRHVEHATRSVYISNPYFLPDPSVMRTLCRAAERGVDVRVLLPGQSDVRVVDYASRAVWPRLLAAGVRIYEWQKTVLHAKSAVVDGRWSTVGTFNFDALSLRSNLEVNVTVFDADFGARLEAFFLQDFAESREVDGAAFQERSWRARWLEHSAYRLRKIL
jgi:cardiolipin synthase